MIELVSPPPPIASISLPWDEAIDDPVAAIAAARAEHGDTFAVVAPDTTYLFVFSPAGVANFYAIPEADASKGIADWQMLLRKLPDELFLGRRTFPHDLFARDDVAQYLGVVGNAIESAHAELGSSGTLEIFAFTRRLGHRIGLATWAGPCGAPGPRFEALITALDTLDGAAAFVAPGAMHAVARDHKTEERAALARVEALIGEAIRERDEDPNPPSDHFQRIIGAWDGTADREQGIARDVVLVHLGSMSNLFAALGWYLVDVVTRPGLRRAIAAGDRDLAERAAMESIRLAQRSIMLRAVTHRCEIADESHTYSVQRGVTLATLLPLTNCPAPTSTAPTSTGPTRSADAGLTATDLADFDPSRWSRRRLRADRLPAARELVTTFGHGSHTCPAQPFSLAVMTAALTAFITAYDVAPRFTDARHLPGQIGGVARAAEPCMLEYSRRDVPDTGDRSLAP